MKDKELWQRICEGFRACPIYQEERIQIETTNNVRCAGNRTRTEICKTCPICYSREV